MPCPCGRSGTTFITRGTGREGGSIPWQRLFQRGRQSLTASSVGRTSGVATVAFVTPQSRQGHAARVVLPAAASSPPRREYDKPPPTGTPVGDTRGAVLRFEDVSISHGSVPIVSSVLWAVHLGERWGIVGPNECDKSILVRVGYLRQTVISSASRSVMEEARTGMEEVERAAADVRAAIRLTKLLLSAKTYK